MSSRKLKRLIGIDFGTSASVVCYKDYAEDDSTDLNAPTNLAWGLQNSSTVPTLIYSDEEGRKYYGYDADQRGISKPDKLIANFKMDLVNPDATKRKQAGELLQEFLHFLYEAYERQTTTPPNTEIVEETYISYPAKWPAEIRQITVKAAQTAGFANVKGMDEPSAAMRYLLSTDTQDIRNLTRAGIIQTGKPLIILLIDMGAGTTDLVLYRYVPGEVSDINVLATWPTVEETATFGGGEIDKILATILKDYLEKHSQPQITVGEDRLSRLMNECKDWKERILAPSLNEGVTPEEPLTIDNYKAMVGVGFDRHFDIIGDKLRQNMICQGLVYKYS
jgi:molecular chaperone DnaK (HSP70)